MRKPGPLLPLVTCLALLACPGVAVGLGDPPPYAVSASRLPKPVIPLTNKRPAARQVLLISVDGLSFEMLRRHRFRLPNLRRLIRRGSWRPMASVFPSMTWSAHVSLVTGQYPRHHGVLGNRWLENGKLIRPYRDADADARRRARVPSLFELVARSGGEVAALNWPATQGSTAIKHNMPEVMYDRRLAFTFISPALRKLLQTRQHRELRRGRTGDYLGQLVGRIAHREGVETDLLVRDIATWLVKPRRPRWLRPDRLRCGTRRGRCVAPRGPRSPRLMLVHLLTPDSWMHRYGTNRWVVRWGLEQADAAIGVILRAYRRAGLLKSTAVLVVSDHGFVEIERLMNLPAALKAAGLERYRAMLNGHAAFLYRDAARAEDGRLVKLLRDKQHSACVEAVYSPAAYTALGLPWPRGAGKAADDRIPREHPGAPALVALSRPTCIFRGSGPLHAVLGRPMGFHGYLPNHPSLKAALIAAGAGLRRRGLRRGARIVDIAPTIAHILGLSWPSHWPAGSGRRLSLDGVVLRDMLQATAGSESRPPIRPEARTPVSPPQAR